jgi:hypothetical protein
VNILSDLIVWGSVGLVLAFVGAWLAIPGWRAAIEQPKFTFLDDVRGYDADRRMSPSSKESSLP